MSHLLTTTNCGQLFELLGNQPAEIIRQMGETINWHNIEAIPRKDDRWEDATLLSPLEILLLHETPARVKELLLPLALQKSPEHFSLPDNYEVTESKIRAIKIAIRNVDWPSLQTIADSLGPHQLGRAYNMCLAQWGMFCEAPEARKPSQQCEKALEIIDDKLRTIVGGTLLLAQEERLELLKHKLLSACLNKADLAENRKQWAGYWVGQVKNCTIGHLREAIEHFVDVQLLNLIWKRQPKGKEVAQQQQQEHNQLLSTQTANKLNNLLLQLEQNEVIKIRNTDLAIESVLKQEATVVLQQFMELAQWSIENLIVADGTNDTSRKTCGLLLTKIASLNGSPQLETGKNDEHLLQILQENNTPVVTNELQTAFSLNKGQWLKQRLHQALAQQQNLSGLMRKLAVSVTRDSKASNSQQRTPLELIWELVETNGSQELRQQQIDLVARYWDEINQLSGTTMTVETFTSQATLNGKEKSTLELKIHNYREQKNGRIKLAQSLRI